MRSLYLAALFSLASLSLWGQATSQIQGIVKDSTGAAIAGATIKATQTATGVVRTTDSAADGLYILPSLPIGPYRFEVTKPGFSTYVQNGIVLQVASSPEVDVTLNVGEVSTQVQVEANAALVDTQGTSVGAVIEQKRIVELPLNGRNPVELIQLAGAAVPAGKNNTAGYPGGLNISVAGGLLSGVTYYLDGTLYNNPFDATNLPFPFPDALQEFKVETSALTAQNGLHSGAAVSAVVKSGTNAFHGDLFEFLRNGVFNARNALAVKRDTLKRNQFGGTLGGAIIKNKLFFFGGYQGTILRSDPTNLSAFVPTPQMLAGDFSGCATGPMIDPLTGQAFPNRQIPTSRLNPQSLKLASLLPQGSTGCGQVNFGPITQTHENQYLARADYQINDKQLLFVRYMASKFGQATSYSISKNILDATQGALDDFAQTWGIGHTYLVTPNKVNTFRAAYNRLNVLRHDDDYASPCDLGVKNFTCFVPHQSVFVVTGGFTVGSGTYIDASFVPSTLTISDDFSIVHGAHQISFGFSAFKYQHSQKANVFSSATFNFGGLAAGLGNGTGTALADFMMGNVSSLTQGLPNTVFTTKYYAGLYAMDTWKASRKLTVNIGMRWEPAIQQRLNNGAVYNYSPDANRAGTRSTTYPQAPPGITYPGDPGFYGLSGVHNRYNQFAPRIGISYDPKGDGKTVFRVAGGISYDFPNTQIMSTPATAPPFGNAITGTPGPIDFSNPWNGTTFNGVNPFATSVPGAFVNYASYMAMNPNSKSTTTYSWNASLQHQFGSNWVVSATYMGSETAHLWVTIPRNPAILIPGTIGTCPAGVTTGCNAVGNTNQRRLSYLNNPSPNVTAMAATDEVETGGTINYNGLLLAVQKRLTKGISLNANYTYSHCIGDITQASTVLAVGGGLNKIDDRHYDRGNCQTPTLDGTQALDRRHIGNITAVLESPKFSNHKANMVGGGWRLSTSFVRRSGAWQTVTTGVDFALNGQAGTQRPNLALNDTASSNQGGGCPTVLRCVDWLNPAAFSQPANGTYGNLGRSNVPGPGYFSLDTALSRTFRIREGKTLEARGEAFNLTNSVRLGGVTTALNSANFGKILTAQDPRIVQLALKFVF